MELIKGRQEMKAFAVAAVAVSAAYLEVHGKTSDGLWLLVAIYILFGDGSLKSFVSQWCEASKKEEGKK
jgi:hypothetical protein